MLNATDVNLTIKIQNLGEKALYLRAVYTGFYSDPKVCIPNADDIAFNETLVPLDGRETKEEILKITNEEQRQTFTFIIVWESDKGLAVEHNQFSFYLQKE